MEFRIGTFCASGEARTRYTDQPKQMPVGSTNLFVFAACLPTMVQNMTASVYKYIYICIQIFLLGLYLVFLSVSVSSRFTVGPLQLSSQLFHVWINLSSARSVIELPLPIMWIPEDRSSGRALEGRVQAGIMHA